MAPASADAATLTLRPDGPTFGSWTATPAGTATWDALDDNVFAMTPPSTSSDYVSSATGQAFAEVSTGTAAIPAGQSVTGASVWMYVQTGTVRNAHVYVQTGATVLGSLTVPVNTPAGWYSAPLAAAPATQAEIDAIRMGFTHSGSTGTATVVYAAYVQVDTTDPPPPPPDDPPVDDPPVDDPPVDDPPVDDPPVDDPPVDDPPVDDPPVDDPPVDDPPVDDPPVDDPPVDDPPVDDPPVDDPPVDDPPVDDPPVDDPPVDDPPVDDPPVLDPPVLDPPSDPVDPGTPTDPTGPTVPPVDTDPLPPVVPDDDTPEPDLSIGGGNATTTATSTGVVPVQLACPDTATEGCSGVIWIEESLDAGSKNQQISSARRSPKRFSKPKKYKLRKGQRKSIPVRLDRRTYRKFKNKRSFKVTVVAQQKDATGQVVTMRRAVRVFNSKKKKKKTKR